LVLENTNQPLKIAITGGIGSGKTTICKVFEAMGIPVYYSDDRAKWLMVNDLELMDGVRGLFGQEAYFEDGSLNRKLLGSIVFNDKSKLEALEAIVHPAVFRDGDAWHKSHTDVPYTMKETALLFETKGYQDLDFTITVFASKEVRLQRVMARDYASREAIEARMDKQLSEDKKIELADFVIYNDGEQLILPQIRTIHQALLKARQSNESA